jgi:diaminopimelate epimerase
MVYDFEWLFYNNDGSTASMCGNGTRAVAHYAYTHQIAASYMKFLTGAGEINCKVEDDIVETTMTKPKVIKQPFYEFDLNWWLVDTGVPHLVTVVEDLEKFDLEICSKMRYAHNANVNYAQVIDGKLYVRTYERGVENETQACGTGMVASFLRTKALGYISNSVDVYPKSGEKLTISQKDDIILFKGKVNKVSMGEF